MIMWKRRTKFLQSNYTVVSIACNMKPSTWINQSRIPALKNIIRIVQIGPKRVQGITCWESQVENRMNYCIVCIWWENEEIKTGIEETSYSKNIPEMTWHYAEKNITQTSKAMIQTVDQQKCMIILHLQLQLSHISSQKKTSKEEEKK